MSVAGHILLTVCASLLCGSIAFLLGLFYGYVQGRHDERFLGASHDQ